MGTAIARCTRTGVHGGSLGGAGGWTSEVVKSSLGALCLSVKCDYVYALLLRLLQKIARVIQRVYGFDFCTSIKLLFKSQSTALHTLYSNYIRRTAHHACRSGSYMLKLGERRRPPPPAAAGRLGAVHVSQKSDRTPGCRICRSESRFDLLYKKY